jgi:hypothetical protein
MGLNLGEEVRWITVFRIARVMEWSPGIDGFFLTQSREDAELSAEFIEFLGLSVG